MKQRSHIGGCLVGMTALAALACGQDRAEVHGFRRVELAITDDIDAQVAERAREARALGLVPIVHMQTPWNTGLTLERNIDDPQVIGALEGFYLIEITGQDTWLDHDDATTSWASLDVLCGSYAQTLHAVGPQGERIGPSASPGKDGPRDARQNAAMIRSYRALLDEARAGETVPRCAPLRYDGQ